MEGENSAGNSRLLLSLDLGGNANDVPALPQRFPSTYKSCTTRVQSLSKHSCDISRNRVAGQSVPSKLRNSEAKHRSYATDRRRKIKVAERIGALKELLPHPQEAGEEYILEDIIDHIKNLQRQVKEPSTSRLRGESSPDPLFFLEGHGHYLPNAQMLDSSLSLEEVMGHFLEENPLSATQLLESRGFLVMPMELADGLSQAK